MTYVKDAFNLYKFYWWKIFIICVIFVLPFQLINLFVANYFFTLFEIFEIPVFGHLFVGFFNLMFLMMMQLPFIYFVILDINHGEVRVGQVFRGTLEKLFPVYIMSVIYAFFVMMGLFFLIIPGLTIMILFYLFPYVSAVEGLSGWQGFKRSLEVGKSNFFKLMGVVLLFAVIEWIFEFGALLGSVFITTHFFTIALVQIGLNTLFIPFYTFVISGYFLDWTGNS